MTQLTAYARLANALKPKGLVEYLRDHLRSMTSVVDLGCGADSPLKDVDGELYKVGVELFEPALEESKSKGIHDEYVLSDVLQLKEKFDENVFDAAIAIDLLEHLTPEEGRKLISEMEYLARKKIVLFTPNGFVPQEPYNGNPFQTHKSGWSVAELRSLGFEVVGINGWRPLRGERAQFVGPSHMTRLMSYISQRFVSNNPNHAFQLFCYKELDS